MHRQMIITYAPGRKNSHVMDQTPMLRIANRFLLDSGFTVGCKIDVQYENGKIIITLNKTYDNNNGK